MLRKGTTVTNRALQLLEKRNVIVRQHRRGAYVAESQQSDAPLRRVHLLVHQHYLETEGTANDGVLFGIQGELPGTSVSINYLPSDDETAYVDRLIADSLDSNEPDGFVLIRSSLETQRHLVACGLPTVYYGTVYASVEKLPSVSRDMFEIGRLAGEYLISRGRTRLVYFSRCRTMAGDHQTFDGIRQALIDNGRSLEDLEFRFLPSDKADAAAAAMQLMASRPEETGFLCRNVPLAEGAASVVQSVVGPDAIHDSVVVCDYYLKAGETAKYVYPRPTLGPEEQGRVMGRMLAAQARGEAVDPIAEVAPVEIRRPGEGARVEGRV